MCRWFDSSSGQKTNPKTPVLGFFLARKNGKDLPFLWNRIEAGVAPRPRSPARETRAKLVREGFQFWPYFFVQKNWAERNGKDLPFRTGIEMKGPIWNVRGTFQMGGAVVRRAESAGVPDSSSGQTF